MLRSRAGVRLAGLLLATAVLFAQDQPARIGEIEFFGYSGIDLAVVRSALPLHEGDTVALSDETIGKVLAQIKDAVHRVTGHEPTDIDPCVAMTEANG